MHHDVIVASAEVLLQNCLSSWQSAVQIFRFTRKIIGKCWAVQASDMLLLFHAAESRAAEWIPQTRVPRSDAGILEAEMFGVEVMKDWSGRGHKMEGA